MSLIDLHNNYYDNMYYSYCNIKGTARWYISHIHLTAPRSFNDIHGVGHEDNDIHGVGYEDNGIHCQGRVHMEKKWLPSLLFAR